MGSGLRWLSAVSLGVLLLASAAGAADPTITEFSAGVTANSLPYGITAGPDGNLWFIEIGARIGKITPAGVVTEYSAHPAIESGINGIAAGPDGNLWFTEDYGIGKITTAGAVTDYHTGGGPRGIVAGPDGRLWFTDDFFASGGIGAITTGGQLTLYTAGITGFPFGIAAGPDGNIWFTTPESVGKITTSGVVTEYNAGITGNPDGITAGPDGNLWFTDSGKIGKITTGGIVTEYSVGIAGGSGPSGIAAGPDGNLWFTGGETADNISGDRIGKITTAGVVTDYFAGITTHSGPLGITAGPDGNIWFTEYSGGRIGRLDLHATAPTPTPTSTNHLSATFSRRATVTHSDGSEEQLSRTVLVDGDIVQDDRVRPLKITFPGGKIALDLGANVMVAPPHQPLPKGFIQNVGITSVGAVWYSLPGGERVSMNNVTSNDGTTHPSEVVTTQGGATFTVQPLSPTSDLVTVYSGNVKLEDAPGSLSDVQKIVPLAHGLKATVHSTTTSPFMIVGTPRKATPPAKPFWK